MADYKITQLSEETSITNDDLFIVVENASGATKKVQASNILPAGSVGTADLADGAVTPAKLVSGTGTSWTWQTWTPTWTNFTVGNGTLTARYAVIGKTVHAYLRLVFGTTSAFSGSVAISVPVTASSSMPIFMPLGVVDMTDLGVLAYRGDVSLSNTTQLGLQSLTASGTYVNTTVVNGTTPFTWSSGDTLQFTITYEAA